MIPAQHVPSSRSSALSPEGRTRALAELEAGELDVLVVGGGVVGTEIGRAHV